MQLRTTSESDRHGPTPGRENGSKATTRSPSSCTQNRPPARNERREHPTHPVSKTPGPDRTEPEAPAEPTTNSPKTPKSDSLA